MINKTFLQTTAKQTSRLHFLTWYGARVIPVVFWIIWSSQAKPKQGQPMDETSPRRDEAMQESALAHPLGRAVVLLVTLNSNQTNPNQH